MSSPLKPTLPMMAILLFLLVGPPDPAKAAHGGTSVNCANMFALGLAQEFHLADCNLQMGGASAPTADDLCWNTAGGVPMTANECADKVFISPPPPDTTMTSGSLVWRYLAACNDGLGGSGFVCPGQEVRCVDGTRPGFYIDWARDTNGNEIPSDRWLFYFSGGGGCVTGNECWDDFVGAEVGDTSTCNPVTCPFADPDGNGIAEGRAIVPAFLPAQGILNPSSENLFHGFNRVRLEKCTDDAYMGTTIDTAVVTPHGVIDELPHHGNRFLKRVYRQLANPANFPGHPTLDQADTIVLVGNSGGGKNLIFTGDDHRDFLEGQILAGSAEIRLVVDAHFLPALEQENALNAGALDVYDGDLWRSPDPPGSWLLPPDQTGSAGLLYSIAGFVTGTSATSNAAYQPPIDTSCLTEHALQPEVCNDQQHILLNHLTTPTFVRMDINDNVKRNDHPPYADDPLYIWENTAFRTRVQQQLFGYAARYQSASELALDTDMSPAAPDDNARKPADQNIAAWAPWTFTGPSHTGLLNADHFGFPSADAPVQLVACHLGTGEPGVASPETGWSPGPPSTAMSALFGWVDAGTAIDAVRDLTNPTHDYLWVEAGTLCPEPVPTASPPMLVVFGLAVGLFGAGLARRLSRPSLPRSGP